MASYTCNRHNVFSALLVSILTQLGSRLCTFIMSSWITQTFFGWWQTVSKRWSTKGPPDLPFSLIRMLEKMTLKFIKRKTVMKFLWSVIREQMAWKKTGRRLMMMPLLLKIARRMAALTNPSHALEFQWWRQNLCWRRYWKGRRNFLVFSTKKWF